MVSEKVVLLLAVFRLQVVFCLPVLQESPEITRQARSPAEPHYPILGRLTQDGPLLKQWFSPQLVEDEDYPSSYLKSRPDVQNTHQMETLARPHQDSRLTHRRTLDYPVTKRSEEANIPTMGLGVLSDLRKFFDDLRVNLDSTEEAAALGPRQAAFRDGSANPSDFLSFLSRHGGSKDTTSTESGLMQNPTHIRRLMFGYNHDDQPYIHSGLGK